MKLLIAKADALAMLSEGWCPICGTEFRDDRYKGHSGLHCVMGYPYEHVQREVAEWPEGGNYVQREDPA